MSTDYKSSHGFMNVKWSSVKEYAGLMKQFQTMKCKEVDSIEIKRQGEDSVEISVTKNNEIQYVLIQMEDEKLTLRTEALQ